ncbi:hypothetical protein Syun_019420 [Stephania yunnanensis]|uniref:Uncharacterized protein n=1 Tax=Stephania yunnanensis TaxID=152371 RepID=A0AAP0IVS8_9MAGN
MEVRLRISMNLVSNSSHDISANKVMPRQHEKPLWTNWMMPRGSSKQTTRQYTDSSQ